jgi:hypothetical protein
MVLGFNKGQWYQSKFLSLNVTYRKNLFILLWQYLLLLPSAPFPRFERHALILGSFQNLAKSRLFQRKKCIYVNLCKLFQLNIVSEVRNPEVTGNLYGRFKVSAS